MNQDTIFLVSPHGGLEAIPERPFDSENLLQDLIARYPDLLAGGQIEPDDPPRWLLVTREAGIPDHEGGSDRWSMDHLLLDQHGRPTFVEVKRSSDTRIRREVVGQMLDYAANAEAYWPESRIRALAAEQYGSVTALETKLTEFLGGGDNEDAVDTEAYWSDVEGHLRHGLVRMLFVADRIPTELRRIIEFLNDQMQSVDVLGIEIHQYQGKSVTALVPRVVGQTEFARQQKIHTNPTSRRITRGEFLEQCAGPAQALFNTLFQMAESSGYTLTWGAKFCAFRTPNASGVLRTVFYACPAYGQSGAAVFQVYLSYFSEEAVRDRLRKRCLAMAKFVPKAKYTLEIEATSEGAPTIEKIAPELFNLIREEMSIASE